MIESTRAVLKFYSNVGNIVRFSIPRARMDKTAEQALASVNALLATNVLTTGDGVPSTLRSVDLVKTQRVAIV